MPLAAIQQENPCKIYKFPKQEFRLEQMESTAETAAFDENTDKAINEQKRGMNNFPLEIYNTMIEYSLTHGKIRNAMLMVCMANWGMRFSDVVRVRFGHLFDNSGKFRESFSLPNGEKKTKKTVVYYNNKATEEIIKLYLSQPENSRKSRLDFLFTSESGNKLMATVRDIEADDLYDPQIEAVKGKIKNMAEKMPDKKDKLLDKYIEEKITEEVYNDKIKKIDVEIAALEQQLSDLNNRKESYVSPTPNAENIYIQIPITHTAGEDIIKNTLRKIGINPKNRKDKTIKQTTDDKYNTHSLRKTFADWFIKTGNQLDDSDDSGEFNFNDTILELLKEKFKHSSKSVTTHYTDAQEEAFKTICQHMNIGLEVLEKYMEK